MSFLQSALELAALGFYVFPLVPGSKLPLIEDYPHRATRDPEVIRGWWLDPVLGTEQPFNVGISTDSFGKDQALLAIDVDNKEGKNGDEELIRLEMQGLVLPETFEQKTPTGGRHFLYVVPEPVKQGADVLGRGLDIRSRGGYLVGRGSSVEGGTYTSIDRPLALAPDWVVSRCGSGSQDWSGEAVASVIPIDRTQAFERAAYYLRTEAPLAVQGESGDQTTFRVAARVKDFGVDEVTAFELMAEHWNPRCLPPWPQAELYGKVQNAYTYGQKPVGADAPENQFTKIEEPEILSPIERLNREFAFVITGNSGHILWETTDPHGKFQIRHLTIKAFYEKFAPDFLTGEGGKVRPLADVWMKSQERRSYDGICFLPGKKAPERFYNLWHGFAVEPLPPGEKGSRDAQEAVAMFRDHLWENICQGNRPLYEWVMAWFAHLIQRPWEKPQVALVLRGKKGVGKNALIERVGYLLGTHALVAGDRRYLTGNFNGHLENLLLFTLDEAFWSGDKQAEGVLKNLITGSRHVIERKGQEPYTVENCLRVVILGNEEWLVPATQDERRFAVLDVGTGRMQDRKFFRSMQEKMEHGGYRLLLRVLLEHDFGKIDVGQAPLTEALLEQKEQSADPLQQWISECLYTGKIIGFDFLTEWPPEMDRESFRTAFYRYAKERRMSSGWLPNERQIGKKLKDWFPAFDNEHKRREGDILVNVYRLPTLQQARRDWERKMGHKIKWEQTNE